MGIFFTKKGKRRAANVRRKPEGVVRRRGKGQPLPRQLICVLAGCAVVAAVCVGAWAYRHFYLYRSSRYTLKQLEIESGPILTREMVSAYLQLETGANLFAVCDIARKRKMVLKNGFVAREVSITRHLPDRLVVRVTEREPVARMADDPGQLVDGGGMVFSGSWSASLPRITGTQGFIVAPGTQLQSMARAAAMFARVLRAMNVTNFFVERIDASREDYLLLTLPEQRRVMLAWEGIGRDDAAAEEKLRERLREVIEVVNAGPKDARTFDARTKNQVYVK